VFVYLVSIKCYCRDRPGTTLESHLVERISTEFNQLQFYVSKCKGLPLVDTVKPVTALCLFYFALSCICFITYLLKNLKFAFYWVLLSFFLSKDLRVYYFIWYFSSNLTKRKENPIIQLVFSLKFTKFLKQFWCFVWGIKTHSWAQSSLSNRLGIEYSLLMNYYKEFICKTVSISCVFVENK